MKKLLPIYIFFTSFGFDPLKMFQALGGIPSYLMDFIKLKNQLRLLPRKDFKFGKIHLCLSDRYCNSGTGSGHYFHQDLLIATRIFKSNPLKHVDVGSRIDGFIAHVAAFRQIEVIDIRPLNNTIKNIHFKQVDLMKELPMEFVDSCDSLSCLHALEHFGLGRYGDPVRGDGYKLGFDNLYNMLKPGGKFFFSVPIGPQRIEFNAHRVFSINFLLDMFKGKFIVDEFSYVDDIGDLHENVTMEDNQCDVNFGCSYGCGIFCLTKLNTPIEGKDF